MGAIPPLVRNDFVSPGAVFAAPNRRRRQSAGLRRRRLPICEGLDYQNVNQFPSTITSDSNGIPLMLNTSADDNS
ncbi:MAG: hypothetical protein RLN77_11065, partial [Rhodospirillales bacterium]